MRRASYRFGVEWIAMNDDAMEMDPDELRDSLTVALLSDLFNVSTDKVVKDVLRFREEGDIANGHDRRMDWIHARGPDILEEIADAWRDPNCPTFVDAVDDVMGSHGSRD